MISDVEADTEFMYFHFWIGHGVITATQLLIMSFRAYKESVSFCTITYATNSNATKIQVVWVIWGHSYTVEETVLVLKEAFRII